MLQHSSLRGIHQTLLPFLRRTFPRNISLRGPQDLFQARNYATGVSTPKTTGYPERLLVYHAGTGQTVFIGCVKLTTMFIFGFSSLVVVPAIYKDPTAPKWQAVAAFACSAIPMLAVGYLYAPYVAYVHLKLPKAARASREHLLIWMKEIPTNTEVDMTTVRFIGLPRVTRMLLGDLRESKNGFGLANLKQVSQSLSRSPKRSTFSSNFPAKYYVGSVPKKGREPMVWNAAMERIKLRS